MRESRQTGLQGFDHAPPTLQGSELQKCTHTDAAQVVEDRTAVWVAARGSGEGKGFGGSPNFHLIPSSHAHLSGWAARGGSLPWTRCQSTNRSSRGFLDVQKGAGTGTCMLQRWAPIAALCDPHRHVQPFSVHRAHTTLLQQRVHLSTGTTPTLVPIDHVRTRFAADHTLECSV